ncbi:MAG: hypothetical protein IJW99_11490 [Clostridia bacterium]|nr:hypothetical protein [Clostridia bacterium]
MNNHPRTPQEKKNTSTAGASLRETRKTAVRKLCVFAALLVIFFVIGLLLPLRPATSALEKRELTKFPSFTWETFWDGSYFNQISEWYADTYPMREGLIGAYHGLQNLYGLRGEQLVGDNSGEADEIPDLPSDEDLPDIVITDRAETGTAAVTEPTDPVDPPDDPVDTTAPPTGGGDVPEPERSGSLYIVGDSAYDLYYFSTASADRYASLITRAGNKLNGQAKVYSILVPLSYSVNLDKATQNKIGVSDAEQAIQYMYAKMDGGNIVKVPIYKTLKEHASEYLYFRTDHHWTALGAYYAYSVFCAVRGIPATPLSHYTVTTYEGFLGTHYSATGSSKLEKDTITAYIPSATNVIHLTDGGVRQKYSKGIVTPNIGAMYAAVGSQYNCFLLGDHALGEIHNETKTDGSSVLVVKESFGNAFVPFLVDSYEYIYVIDPRYYSGDLVSFVKENRIQDVIFINNLSATGSSARMDELEDLIG